jgi:hypothetical protein
VSLNVVVGRPEARWLPSRHHFALARLIAFAQLIRGRRSASSMPEHLILSIDRGQSAAENHSAAIWIFLTTASYIAALLPMRMPLAFIAAVPLTFVILHIPIVVGGPILRLLAGDENHVNLISMTTMALLLIWSSYVARSVSWARFVAWFFFAVVAGNAISWLILWLLRRQVRAAEDRCVL